jgi:hypothetical protein
LKGETRRVMSQTRTPIDFDIDRYMRASKRLDLSEVAWDDIANHHLSDGAVLPSRPGREAVWRLSAHIGTELATPPASERTWPGSSARPTGRTR